MGQVTAPLASSLPVWQPTRQVCLEQADGPSQVRGRMLRAAQVGFACPRLGTVGGSMASAHKEQLGHLRGYMVRWFGEHLCLQRHWTQNWLL